MLQWYCFREKRAIEVPEPVLRDDCAQRFHHRDAEKKMAFPDSALPDSEEVLDVTVEKLEFRGRLFSVTLWCKVTSPAAVHLLVHNNHALWPTPASNKTTSAAKLNTVRIACNLPHF